MSCGYMISKTYSQFLDWMSFLMMRVLVAFLRFISLQTSTKLWDSWQKWACSLGGRRNLMRRLGISLIWNSMISCMQMLPMSFMIHLILMWSMQMREVMLRQCTTMYVIRLTYSRAFPPINSRLSSSSVSMSRYPSSNFPSPPISTMTSRSARLSSSGSRVGPRVQVEQQMASVSSLYLMQDWTKTMSSWSLWGELRAQTSNSIWLKSWQLPSVYLTRQKGSFSFILCSSICWISYFLFLCRMQRLNWYLFSCSTWLSIPSWKCDGTSFSKYLMCMNSGSILSSIFSLKFSSSMFLYSRRNRRIVGQIDFTGVVPENLWIRPSLRLVWKISRLSPSTNRMSGRCSFKVLAPLRHRASRIFLSQ